VNAIRTTDRRPSFREVIVKRFGRRPKAVRERQAAFITVKDPNSQAVRAFEGCRYAQFVAVKRKPQPKLYVSL
jgi:hypothetical protein